MDLFLDLDSKDRKESPIWSGFLRYFPRAVIAVARHSFKGNQKHNPGEPLHWAKNKSSDHGDALMRHQLEPEAFDPEFGDLHAVGVAWRAMAQLETIIDKRIKDGLPLERG